MKTVKKKTQKKGAAAAAADRAAERAREAQQNGAAEHERAREEEERRREEASGGDGGSDEEGPDHEDGAAGGAENNEERAAGGSDEAGDVTKKGKKADYAFSVKNEERMAEFFSVNPIFYDKGHANYFNQQKKDKLLDELASEIHTTRKQIQGWFKNIRTSVGKLYKTKSGQATQPLTAKKKWQLENFAFMRDHIVPRTYTLETTPLEETGEQSLDEDNEPLDATTPTRPASPSPSTTANARNTKAPAGRNTKPPASKKSKIDDLLVKFLDRPSPADVFSKQLETIAAAPAPVPPPDERTSFSQWIAVRMSRIPPDRWDDFQLAAMRLLQDYTSPTAQPRPMPPVQQQWANVPQQNFPQQNCPQQQHQQWGQTQAWQEQWPQQQKQVWPQSSSSGQPQIQLLDDTPVQPPAQPMRQTNELGAPRSQSVPPILDSSLAGIGLTDAFMKQLQAANSSGTPQDPNDD